MQQLVLAKRGVLEWREVVPPQITGSGQALVRPLAIARCDLDIAIAHGQTLFRPPFPIGHEFVGEIAEISEDLAPEFPKGTKVAVAFQVACGSCGHCQEGHSNSCNSISGFHDYGMGAGGKNFGGALADLILVPYARHMLLALPEDTDLIAVASLSDNIVEAWKLAGFYLEEHPRVPVLVLGGHACSIGLYTAGLAHAMGSEVLYLDSDVSRLEIAAALGATCEQIKEIPKVWSRRFPLVVDASNLEEGYRFCMRSAAVGGVITSASIFWTNDFKIPYMDLYNSGATLMIRRVDSKEMMPKILSYISNGKLAAQKVVTRVATWGEAKEAWLEKSTKLVVKR